MATPNEQNPMLSAVTLPEIDWHFDHGVGRILMSRVASLAYGMTPQMPVTPTTEAPEMAYAAHDIRGQGDYLPGFRLTLVGPHEIGHTSEVLLGKPTTPGRANMAIQRSLLDTVVSIGVTEAAPKQQHIDYFRGHFGKAWDDSRQAMLCGQDGFRQIASRYVIAVATALAWRGALGYIQAMQRPLDTEAVRKYVVHIGTNLNQLLIPPTTGDSDAE